MSQPKSVTQRATAAARYIAVQDIPDPISPLAEAVVSGIKEVLSDEDRTDAALERIRVRVVRALEDSLAQGSSKGKALRMALITKLASDEAGTGELTSTSKVEDLAAPLSTVEAAKILNMSRPYVTMLCDAGKLGPIEVTDGGHRRIPREAVEHYRLHTLTQYDDAPTPRQAGVEAGLYEHDDSHYTNVTRGRNAAAVTSGKEAKTAAKKARP